MKISREAKKSMSKRLSMLVATSVVASQIVSSITPAFAEPKNDLKVETLFDSNEDVELTEGEKSKVYTVLFDGTEEMNWNTLVGGGTHEIEDGFLKITRDTSVNNEFTFFDENAPMDADIEAEMRFKLDGNEANGVGRFGFVLRPQTDGAYIFVGYDLGTNWRISKNDGSGEDFTGPALTPGTEYTMQVRLEGSHLTVYLDGEEIFNDDIDLGSVPATQSYGVGFKTWYGLNDAYVNYFKAGPIGTVIVEEQKEIASVDEVSIETYAGVRPELPNKVNVTYTDGTENTENVAWETISKDLYKNPGNFEVTGTIEGRDTTVTATVVVNESLIEGEVVEKVIRHEGIEVYLDNTFPRVIRYEIGEDVLQGEEERLYLVNLNGDEYVPTVAFTQINENTAEYLMTFEELNLSMKVQMKLIDGKTLRMEVTEINESGDFEVQTISFPNHNLATVKDTDNGKVSSVLTTGDWNNIRESFEEVSEIAVGNHKKTYGIINNDKFAISIDNNTIEGGNRVNINVADIDGYKKAGISNGTWTYREPISASNTLKFTGTIGTSNIISKNLVIASNETSIQDFMGNEYEAVYCGLGTVEDYEGKDLTGKVAIVDRGDFALVDKAKNAMDAGAEYLIMINNIEGTIPEQGYQNGVNVIGISKEKGEEIKAQLDEDNTINVNFNSEREQSESVPGGPEELPWSQIMIARDENESGEVDWQDAAILYRRAMDPVQGGENIPNSFSYIPFNIGSLAQSPFLDTADTVKKLSNYTDGFGQFILEKGYQAEGHDDAIADIGGHTGIRQGGKDDLNKLIEIGKEYNAKVGVHVNVTEYHLDAFELDVNNLKPGFQTGWSWKDNSYYVDQRKDVTTGELERRFDMLKEDHPDLDWVYIDVYNGNGWNANELAEIVNGHDWMLATEFNGPLEQQVAWTHWGGDPAYPNRGNESEIIRFIRNQEQDVFMSDDLLKGAKHALSGGWGTRHDIEGFYAIETFYNQTLPTKYMQHFEIMEWKDNGTDGFVKFTDGLESKREDGAINMYKDGKLIATTEEDTIDDRGIGKTKLFMHWTWDQLGEEAENKIYHWNPYGGETTWEIPNDWAGTETVKVYELSDLGKTFVEELQVVDGEVTIDAKENTPYVLFQEEVSEERIDNWGEGTLINDPGFDSQTLDNWNVTTTAKNMEHINIVNEQVDRRRGNDALVIQGEVKPDLSIIPQSEMTATTTNSQSGEGADKAIDGNPSTMWHTSWSGTTMPQSITLDLGSEYEIDKFTCLPRQAGENGKITKYEVQVSTDGENFTKVAEGSWNTAPDLKVVEFEPTQATHIRLIAKETVGDKPSFFASVAELNVHKHLDIPEEDKSAGKDASMYQDIDGLEPGKTYSASVWVKSLGEREIKFGVNCGDENIETEINNPTTRTNAGEGFKWYGERISRMKVEFTVPEGETTARIYLDVAESEEDTLVMIDDFRIWTNPLGTEATDRDGYVIYEDFENVDEGHGPFYMGRVLGTDNRTHYAEKNPEGGQYMNWVIEDRFSLKTNQQAGTVGEMLVTDETTMKLEPNTTYEVGFKYTNKVDNLYSVAIKSGEEGTLFTEVLHPGQVVGSQTDGSNYSREVKEYKKVFTTGEATDYYLSIDKANGFDELVLDNLYVKEIKESEVENGAIGLTVDSEINIDETTNLQIAINDIVEGLNAYTADFTVNYDSSVFDLGNVTAVSDDYMVAYEEVSEGEIRVLVATKGTPIVSAENLVNVELTAKSEAEASPIVVNGTVSDGETIKDVESNTATVKVVDSSNPGETVDKTKLGDLIDKIEALEEAKYIPSTWVDLEGALESSIGVFNNAEATQAEVNGAYDTLLRSYLELRLIPNKEALEDLINSVENLNKNDYTTETWEAVETALVSAKAILINDEASETEVANAEKELNEAVTRLAKADSTDENSKPDAEDDKDKDKEDLPQTGGASSVALGVIGTLLASAGAFLSKKKNKK